MENGYMWIDLNRSLIKVMGKGGKERMIPFGDDALSWLITYIEFLRKDNGKVGARHRALSRRLLARVFVRVSLYSVPYCRSTPQSIIQVQYNYTVLSIQVYPGIQVQYTTSTVWGTRINTVLRTVVQGSINLQSNTRVYIRLRIHFYLLHAAARTSTNVVVNGLVW